ncbi:hypothetical protein Tco_1541986 [Tanacetum coccineum]
MVRDIHRAGFKLFHSVKDGILNGNWAWPIDWYVKYPLLNMYTIPSLIPNTLDWLIWMSHNRVDKDFFVSISWDSIRPRGDVVNWYNMVWFSHAIPRHAFHLWLVWDHLKTYAGLPNSSASLDSIVDMLIPISKKKSARSVIAKLVFAASSYFIWQERNSRLFKNKRRCKDQLIEVIMTMVRLKLLTCRFKRTASVEYFFQLWNLPTSLIRSSH